MSSTEEIKQANAAELGHIVNQLTLSSHQRKLLSQFLLKADDTAFGYNIKLKKCISWIKEIPFSEEFVKRLVYLNEPPEAWERHLPIECTPKTHIIHALYRRILERGSGGKDLHIGTPIPSIFYRETNVLTRDMAYTIGSPDRLYQLRKPFGYDFPDYIEANGMVFKFMELWNPLYVKRTAYTSEYLGAPTPINIHGKLVEPYSNTVYTFLYKQYIFANQSNLKLRAEVP